MSAEADVVVVEEDQESGSEEVCDICRDETSTPEHPIVFCDGVDCKVAVHQECYGIAELPSGPWKCDCCSMGLQPATTPCLLCPNFGGAMKRVLNELPDGKIVLTNDWCHAFCATLINETFIQGFEGGEAVFGVSLALKQRSKLKCVVCNVKQGACAQCLSDRCAVAIHPTCALNAGLPISTKGDKHFGFLCTRHARAPAPAAAPGASPSGGDGEPATTDADVTPATAKRVITPSTSVVSTGRPPSRPKTTSKAEPSSASKPRGRPKSQNKVSKPKPVIDSEEEGLDDFDAPDDTPALTTSNRLWPILEPIFFGKQKDAAWKLLEESQIPSPYSSPKALSPAVHTVAVQQTVSASQQADMGVMPMATDTTDAPSTIPEPLVTVASTDGPALPFGQAADVPLLPVEQTVKVSALPVEPAVEPIAEQPADVATVQVEAPPQPATLPSVQPAGAAALPADVSPSAADAGTILVDDPTLADVDMLVDLSAIFGEESTVAEGIPAIDVPPTVSNAVEGAALTVTVPVQDAAPLAGIPFENPAPAVTLPVVQEGPVSIPGESAIPTVAAAPTPVTLPVEEAVVTLRPPRVDVGPSDLSLELRELQAQLVETVLETNALKRSVRDAAKALEPRDIRYEEAVEWTWRNHEVWKSVSVALVRGVRDQSSDFNKWKDAAVPASWLIPADGRAPEPPPAPVDDNVDDAVCQVCFDGESFETNPIVFCDRCNIAVHKRCYGIAIIPEGEYFCDRCRHLKYSIMDVVCCLCPVPDGAFKRTTDGRWVHIVCALWHKNTVFNDISQMGEVDVTGVFTQKPKIRDVLGSFNLPQLRQLLDMPDVDAPASGSAPFAGPESLTSPTSSTCSECGTSMGATLSCASPGCSHSFHPLCAWYSGLYAVVTLDPEASLLYNPDPNSRGIHYALYCQSHLPPDVSASGRNRLEQRQLRCKYRVSESDVSQPRKAKRKDGQVNQASLRIRVRALPSDIYKDGACGACLDTNVSTIGEEVIACNICSISVHRGCYGLPATLPQGSFTCDRCKHLEGYARARNLEFAALQDISCCLCPRLGGMFKQTVKGNWVHVFCALMMPGTIWANPDEMHEPDLRAVALKRYTLPCYLCNKKKAGACLQCETCYRAFHPMCAQKSDCYTSWIDDGHGFLKGVAYCRQHHPPGFRFDTTKKAWTRINYQDLVPPEFKTMVRLRKDFEMARMLCERVLRREKFKKNIVYGEINLFEMDRELLEDPILLEDRAAAEREERKQMKVVLKIADIPGAQSLKCVRGSGAVEPAVTQVRIVAPSVAVAPAPPVPGALKPSDSVVASTSKASASSKKRKAPSSSSSTQRAVVPAPPPLPSRPPLVLVIPTSVASLAPAQPDVPPTVIPSDPAPGPVAAAPTPAVPTPAVPAPAVPAPAVPAPASAVPGPSPVTQPAPLPLAVPPVAELKDEPTPAVTSPTSRPKKNARVAVSPPPIPSPAAPVPSSPLPSPPPAAAAAGSPTTPAPQRVAPSRKAGMPAAPAASLLDVVIPPPSDFDLAGCPFDPSSANTFQLMMSDRQRFGSTITPDFRMPSLPPQTSSFSEWFDLKVLIPIEPAPPTLVVTPDQVDLDYRLLNILDSVVEGDEAVTLFTLLDLPPAAEDFTDVEEYYRLIEHPISLTMIRDRILRQVYKQTSDLLKDLELLSSNVSLLDLEPTSAVGTDITLLKKRLREVDAKLKSPVSRRRSAPVDPKSSPVPSPTPSPPTTSREHLCKACGVTSLPSVIGKGEQCCAACLVDPSKMLNRRLWVLWPSESKWFPGRIDAFHPASKQFRILYDDGDWEFTLLQNEDLSFSDAQPRYKPQ